MDIVLGKVGAETLGKAVTDATAKPQNSSFQDVLAGADSQLDMQQLSSQLGVDVSDLSSSVGQFEAIPAESVNMDPSHFNVGSSTTSGNDKVVDMLSEVNKGQMQMDSMLNEILYSGKKFSNQELLVMQAQMHHFSEMTELTVKVAEQAVNNIRQIQNTQV